MAMPKNIQDKENEKFVEDVLGNVALRMEASRDASGNIIPREGFIYDMIMRGYDTSFWKTIIGTPVMASNKLRLNAETCASYSQTIKGNIDIPVNVPTAPSAGESKKWGFLNPGDPTKGSIYFEIIGEVFRTVSYDNEGNEEITVLTFADASVEKIYGIEWGDDYIRFLKEGTVVATHSTRVGSLSQAIYLHNADSDNTDFGSIKIKSAGKIIS